MNIKSLLTPLAIGGAVIGAGIAFWRNGSPFTVDKPAGPRAQHVASAPFAAVIGVAVQNGVAPVFVGEVHNDPGGARVAARTLKAVKDAKPGEVVAFHREMGTGYVGGWRAWEKICAQGHDEFGQDQRTNCQNHVVQSFDHSRLGYEAPTADDKASLVSELGKDVALKFMVFDDPNQFDMDRFIQDESVAVGSMGLSHAIGHIDGKGLLSNACLGQEPYAQPYPEMAPAAVRAMFDGYIRAQQQGGSLLVISDDTFQRFASAGRQKTSADDLRDQCHAHLRSRDLLVVRVDSTEFRGTVVAPRRMKGHFNRLSRKFPDAISLVGEGGAGWGHRATKPGDGKGGGVGGS